jgi:phenylpropionate dioxygenase-like ring-hydroxylating dioxygenase large terminal subunit
MSSQSSFGRSLVRHKYIDDEVFADDVRLICSSQWLLADHESRIPDAGDYFLFQIGDQSVIVLRDKTQSVRAFHNVCRHRGSLICTEPDGNATRLVCPYHAWTYGLDGRLLAARAMPTNFEKSAWGLKAVQARINDGLIFLNLAESDPPDFERFLERLRPYLGIHQFGRAKVAVRKSYPTRANWKLVVENFLECYHCKPAHQTYCSVHDADKVDVLAAGTGFSGINIGGGFARQFVEWELAATAKGEFTGMFEDTPDSDHFQAALRLPIGKGSLTESVGGKPVAPLMGQFQDYDGTQTAIFFNPLSHVLASNDYAILVRFTPRGPMETDVEAIWLVDAKAVEGEDYDANLLTQLWDVTLCEDKEITENNQRGVLSTSYVPGPHSLSETRISDFVRWYLQRVPQ